MKLKSIALKNFRGYYNETKIDIVDLTVLVGKNDIGKSTVLEALDIFFNDGKGVVKLDKDDINKTALAEGDNEITISAVFTDLPPTVIIDTTNRTSLNDEYLLNNEGNLQIIKRYPNAGKEKVFIKALHPTNEKCSDLLMKKNSELKAIIKGEKINCENLSVNAEMRKSIWNYYAEDLQSDEVELDVTKGDTKSIWENLQTFLPQYSLFQSDRKNSDGDNEVQDPLKEAVKQILGDSGIVSMLNDVAEKVEKRLSEVSASTLEKLREMNPNVADSLFPIIPPKDSLKWQDVFRNVSICGDQDIPINKRGSGVKRLVLLNFFRAEAERRLSQGNSRSIIYAIEEPETSQHTDHQKMLVKAFIDLANSADTQVLMTTHSSVVVKGLNFDNLRLIIVDDQGHKSVSSVDVSSLPYPSLNEVNYTAFGDVTHEYHNELYGYIESESWLGQYRDGKSTITYRKILKGGSVQDIQITLTEYVRHQIHHPENNLNLRFSFDQLSESIDLMRRFIQDQY